MIAAGTIVHLIGWLILGCIVGPIARLLIPGKQHMSFPMTVILGGIGGFLGGILARNLLGWDTGGIDWIAGIIGAVIAILIYTGVTNRQARGS